MITKKHICLIWIAVSGATMVYPLIASAGSEKKSPTMQNKLVFVAELSEPGNFFPKEVVFDPEGRLLASRAEGNTINIWDWKNKKVEATLRLPAGSGDSLVTTQMQFSPDKRYFAACHSRSRGDNAVITIWNTKSWKEIIQIKDGSVGSGCSSLAFTPDGSGLIRLSFRPSKSSSEELIEYSTGDWKRIWGVSLPSVLPRLLALSGDGKSIAVFGTKDGHAELVYPQGVNESDPVPESRDSVVTIVDREAKKITTQFTVLLAVNSYTRADWHPDGRSLTVASGHGFQTIDTSDLRQVDYIRPKYAQARTGIKYVERLKVSIDFLGAEDGEVRIYDLSRKINFDTIKSNVSAIAVDCSAGNIAVSNPEKISIYKIQ